MADEKFWMVQGKGPATARHLTRKAAVAEASRLLRAADTNTGGRLYIMEAVVVVQVQMQPIEVISLEMHPTVRPRPCPGCGLRIEASRPNSRKCRACDRKAC